jgi:multidrug resistance protein MdtO
LFLRLSGAVIGGLIAGLCIVFVLPHLTDIGQLCLLIAVVSVGAAWVATSSELLSYAGLQIAFAFFLGVLQGLHPGRISRSFATESSASCLGIS